MTRPLHLAYPTLAAKLPFRSIAQLPTPLQSLSDVQGPVLIKHDGQSHPHYGGNKVRKLEYLLGQALSHDCARVATFGAAGSNHATATAVHAHEAGLGCVSFLSRQRNTPWVGGNLRIQLQASAEIIYVDGNRTQREQQAAEYLATKEGRSWLIPMGGSSLAGTIGYVNAGLELAQQINELRIEKPDRIYVPLGTMGTAVGLAIGLRLAGLHLPIFAVRVVHQTVGCAALAERLFGNTVRALRFLDKRIPKVSFDPELFQIRDEQFGDGYAAATDAGRKAMNHAHTHWQLETETTYSAKTIAALLHDRHQGRTQHPLYWATYSTRHPACGQQNSDRLPAPLRQYWTS